MDELRLNIAFVNVVQTGSISAAARALNTSITSVSRQIGLLETSLGVRLLNRTTRRQSLTEVGQIYYSKTAAILRQLDDLKSEVSSHQQSVKGCLRLHLRASVGNHVIVPALPNFLSRHPNLSLDITLTDERADLVAAGVDVAVWLGRLQDSGLIARRLSPSRRVVCASPAYLKKHGYPKTPDDLVNHNCLVYRAKSYDNAWRFGKDGRTIEIKAQGNVQTDSSAALLTSAISGMGVIIVQESMARQSILKGELHPLLEDYEVSPTKVETALYAVYPSNRRMSPKTRAFIDFLIKLFETIS